MTDNRNLNSGVLIAVSRNEGTCFTYVLCVTVKVSLGPRGLAYMYIED